MKLFLLFLLISCSKPVKYSKEEIYKLATTADSSVSFILPKSMEAGVTCGEYGDGCLSAHIVSVRKLELIAVEFMTEEQALFAAKKFRGFYLRNWFFDDVTGEPVLERFMENDLKAKKP